MITLPRLSLLSLLFLLLTVAVAAPGLEQHGEPAAEHAASAEEPAGHQPEGEHAPAAQQAEAEHAPAAQQHEAEHAPSASEDHAAPGEDHAEQNGPGPWQSFFKWANFLAFFGLLGYLLRQPIKEFFAGRTRAIQEGLGIGRRAREEAAQRLEEIEGRLERLEAEITELRTNADIEAETERTRLREAARAETERILAATEQEMRALAKTARGELKSYVAGLAAELAEQRIRGRLTPERQAALLREHAENLRGKQV